MPLVPTPMHSLEHKWTVLGIFLTSFPTYLRAGMYTVLCKGVHGEHSPDKQKIC